MDSSEHGAPEADQAAQEVLKCELCRKAPATGTAAQRRLPHPPRAIAVCAPCGQGLARAYPSWVSDLEHRVHGSNT